MTQVTKKYSRRAELAAAKYALSQGDGKSDERWITIHPHGHEEGTGTPVKIDGRGNIVGGPKGIADKGIKKLSDFGGTGKDKTGKGEKPSPKYTAKGNEIFDAQGVRHGAFRNEEKAKAAADEWNKSGKPGEKKEGDSPNSREQISKRLDELLSYPGPIGEAREKREFEKRSFDFEHQIHSHGSGFVVTKNDWKRGGRPSPISDTFATKDEAVGHFNELRDKHMKPFEQAEKSLNDERESLLKQERELTDEPAVDLSASKGAPTTSTPETREKSPEDQYNQLPDAVKNHIKFHLGRLQQTHKSIVNANKLGARYGWEVADNPKLAADVAESRAKLDSFRKMAGEKGIDAESVLSHVGGEPSRDVFDKAQAWGHESTKPKATSSSIADRAELAAAKARQVGLFSQSDLGGAPQLFDTGKEIVKPKKGSPSPVKDAAPSKLEQIDDELKAKSEEKKPLVGQKSLIDSGGDEENRWSPEKHVAIAADSIGKLRGQDIYRLMESSPPAFMESMARYILKNRPEFSRDVHDARLEIEEERAGKSEEPVTPKAASRVDIAAAHVAHQQQTVSKPSVSSAARSAAASLASHLINGKLHDPSEFREQYRDLSDEEKQQVIKDLSSRGLIHPADARKRGVLSTMDVISSATGQFKEAKSSHESKPTNRHVPFSDSDAFKKILGQSAVGESGAAGSSGPSEAAYERARKAIAATAGKADQAVVNVPLSKRGNIDSQIDKFKESQSKAMESDMRVGRAKSKADKTEAEQLFAIHGPGLISRTAAVSGKSEKEVSDFLKQQIKVNPTYAKTMLERAAKEHPVGEASSLPEKTHAEMKDLVKKINSQTAKLDKANAGYKIGSSRARATSHAAKTGNDARLRDEYTHALRKMVRASLSAGHDVPENIKATLGGRIDYNDDGNYEPLTKYARKPASGQRSIAFHEDDHPRNEAGEFTSTSNSKNKKKESKRDSHGRVVHPTTGQVQSRGEVSEVDGVHYPAGQWMPVHGLTQKTEKKPKSEKPQPSSQPGKANEHAKSREPRVMSKEQIGAEKERRAHQAKWDSFRSSKLGEMLHVGERPHFIKHTIPYRDWYEYAESVPDSQLEKLASSAKGIAADQAMKSEGLPIDSPERQEYIDHNVEYFEGDNATYMTKKHIKARPASAKAHFWLAEAMRNGDQSEVIHKLADLFESNDENYSRASLAAMRYAQVRETRPTPTPKSRDSHKPAPTPPTSTSGGGKKKSGGGWITLGGSHVHIGDDGKIMHGCPGLKGEHVQDLKNESQESRKIREVRQDHAQARGLTGHDVTAGQAKQLASPNKVRQHEVAKQAARGTGHSTASVLRALPDAYELHDQGRQLFRPALNRLMSMTGATPAKARDWENDQGKDWSTWPDFDHWARTVAAEHPELGLDKHDHDTPAKLWDLIRSEGKRVAADEIHSPEVARTAAEMLGKPVRGRKKASQPESESDDSGDFGDTSFDPDKFSRANLARARYLMVGAR